MKISKLFTIILCTILIYSCSDKNKSQLASEYLSSYMKDNKKVVLFGKVNLKDILLKADYENIPKAAVLLKSEIIQYEAAVDLSQGICFAMEGPFDEEGNPERTIAFVSVKNQDSLLNKVASLGLMYTEESDFKFVQENDISIGVKDHLAIFVAKKGAYNGKEIIKEAFVKCNQANSNGKISKILSQKKDVLLGVNFENLYRTSNTSLTNLSAQKKKELDELTNDSFMQITADFQNGQAVIETQNLFSDALMKHMCFKEDLEGTILNKLGKGNARLGLAMNLDMLKIENFLDDFAPELKAKLTNINFQMQMAMATLGSKPLTNLLDGQLGLVMLGDMKQDGSLVPEASLYIGLGNKGRDVKEMLSVFFPKENGLFGMKMEATDKYISVSSGKSTSSKLILPPFTSEFGKNGLTFFVNFEGMDMKSFDLQEGGKALYAFKSVLLTADNKGSKLVITAKKTNENILKQVVDVYIKDLEAKIGAIN